MNAPKVSRAATIVAGGIVATPNLLNMKEEPHMATRASSNAQSVRERDITNQMTEGR